METQIVQSVVTKCKVVDIPNILMRWGFLKDNEIEDIDFKDTKTGIAHSIISLCQDKEKFKTQCNDLDLIYMQTYSSKKKWSVFRIDLKKGKSEAGGMGANPKKFKYKLKSQVALYFNAGTSVAVNLHKGALWARIYIPRPSYNIEDVYQSSNTVYLLYYPHTQYIIVSTYKPSVQEYLLQTIRNTLEASKLTNIQLTGNHVESLIQLALNKNSQGSFTRYRDRSYKRAPFSVLQPRKRKVQEIDRIENVFCENEASKTKRARLLEDNFGPNEQPTLEKVEYKVDVPFSGLDFAPGMSNRSAPFHCKVKFEGPSVLEGFRNLGNTGLAKVPLPSFVGKIHSMAKNSFKIQNRKPTKQTEKD